MRTQTHGPLWFSFGLLVALALHYFIPCDQAKLGHPKMQMTSIGEP